MPDGGLLSYEYGQASQTSKAVGDTLLTIKKRRAGLEAEDVPGDRWVVADLLEVLACLLDPDTAAEVPTERAWQVPGSLVARLRASGVRPDAVRPTTTSRSLTSNARRSPSASVSESSAPSTACVNAACPPAITPMTWSGAVLNVGGHSAASRTPSRPLVPAPM